MRYALASIVAIAGILAAPLPAASGAERPKRVLVFSHTTGFRHDSIEPGVAALRKLAARHNIAVQASENPAMFRAQILARFDAIIFLSSTTDPKNPASEWLIGERRAALQAFVRRGGGIVGIHAATDSHYHWPWYGRLMGGRFASHPAGTPTGTLSVADPAHPATRGLPATIRRTDEYYYFDDYNPHAKLLITVDPQSIGQADVNANPVSWAHRLGKARVFYTALGHTKESYTDPYFLRHVGQGLNWVLAK